ncbi:MAG: ribonuclease R [Gemmatimonadetes bacterium]|nr:ribonuclease R [Gemmatimonadota bacterium]
MVPSPQEVIDYLKSQAGRPLKAKELARGLGVAARDYPDFKALLVSLERDGVLYRVRKQRYAVPERINLVVGRLETTRAGDGWVVPSEGGEDIFIAAAGLNAAMHGDLVVARIERRRRGPRIEGCVIKVLERAHPTMVGTYHRARNFGFVVPEDPRLARDVFVPPGAGGEAQDGDVVVVRITSYGTLKLGPAGEVEKVLGPMDEPGVDILAVLYGHGLPLDFPDIVREAARQATIRVRHDLDVGRADARHLHVFTIDPRDAKDHDDALSVAALGSDAWEVGIHIADVSHFVEEGSELDAEALRRGASVYLVDRLVPMVPEELSADLCSLLPDRDRRAVSLFLTVDVAGRVHHHRFERALIRSRHRLTYEEVQRVLDGEERVDAQTDRAVEILRDLARTLRRRREERGSLDFDLPEARVELDEDGTPVDIQRILRLESHRLVEEFMLLANETVARRAARHRLPFLYRVHAPPDPDRMEQLRELLLPLGYRFPAHRSLRPKDLQRVLKQAGGRPEENLVSAVVLRSMKRAEYSAENRGHFGLATRWYTHFTSPIRRYPDLVVHRAVTRAFLDGKPLPETWTAEKLGVIAELSSERERVADEAERDSVDLKKTEFMRRHLGADFSGTISGVTSFGFFVLLDDYFVDGLVHVSSLDDDYYHFLEDGYALVGERTRRRFRLGDRVRVRVAAVNLEDRKIDFLLVERIDSRGSTV